MGYSLQIKLVYQIKYILLNPLIQLFSVFLCHLIVCWTSKATARSVEVNKPTQHVLRSVNNWIGVDSIISVTLKLKAVVLKCRETHWTVRCPFVLERRDVLQAKRRRLDSGFSSVGHGYTKYALLTATSGYVIGIIPIVEWIIPHEPTDSPFS